VIAVDILPARRHRRVLRLVGVALVVALAAAGWWASAPFRGSASSQTAVGIHKVQGATWRPEANEPLFIAVVGNDARNAPPGGSGRCDAIHIVAINPQQKAGSIINIPRDTWVGSKINDRCIGGPQNMVAALKSLTGIQVQYYVTTEFSHFIKLIDELGGVTVNVPYAMNDSASGAVFPAGPKHMLGGHVLAFSRNRHDTPRGDFSRSFNQGEVIKASLAKYRAEAQDANRILDYMRAAQRNTKFDIPLSEALRLGLLAREIDPANVKNIEPIGRTGSVGAASVVFLEPGDTFQRVKDDGIY
jgi:LCP family protein required for cell wall assembly